MKSLLSPLFGCNSWVIAVSQGASVECTAAAARGGVLQDRRGRGRGRGLARAPLGQPGRPAASVLVSTGTDTPRTPSKKGLR